jgi:hypothetical protein
VRDARCGVRDEKHRTEHQEENMKNNIFFIAIIILILAVTACSRTVKVTCDNQSSYVLLVTGDSTGEILQGGTGDFTIDSGGCLDFNGVAYSGSTITVHPWGHKCFDQDNGFTFYNYY